ncbi:MAG: glycoside hydrolase family 99-like domain-containing protein [Acidobacteriota bacterium]
MPGLARLIALYLPQYHPIPENDEWWGKGFTEWTNTAKAKKLFRNHYQPHVPADLGFYDLRLPEARQSQADLARAYGIEGFCYYHYWFAGRRILERPFQEVLESSQPDFPFCLCWANETWCGVWHGAPNKILIEQTYPGPKDHEAHFAALLPAFADPRHIRVDNKPLFLIYKPEKLPHSKQALAQWRAMAKDAGLDGLYLLGVNSSKAWNPLEHGFDAKVFPPPFHLRKWVSRRNPLRWLQNRYELWKGLPTFHPFGKLLQHEAEHRDEPYECYSCAIHAWDNTPRSGSNGVVVTGSNPEQYGRLLRACIQKTQHLDPDHRLIFLKSWNEWAEGNHLEPDIQHGHAYLETIRTVLDTFQNSGPADRSDESATRKPSSPPVHAGRPMHTGHEALDPQRDSRQ